MNIPTEDDWRSEPWHEDLAWAYKHFRGKTLDEAVMLFEENSLLYQDAVMYMPRRVFGYYLGAYLRYLLSDAARGDSDGASGFITLIHHKAGHQREDLVPVWNEVEPVLRRLAEHQDDFGAEWAIYGCFRTRIREIVKLGFEVSFDTSTPEKVPESVTLRDMGFGDRSTPFTVAAQVFRNSGLGPIPDDATRADILRIFGPPVASGGGEHPKYGRIPDWIRYNRPDCHLRFEFDGERVTGVMFSSPHYSIESPSPASPKPDQPSAGNRPIETWDDFIKAYPPNDDFDEDTGLRNNGL
ncbi:hypothetical protein [Singulisphaera sp. PoT]|uniref:hypothetical protein n=1 Tax=Singulisphaera sp. PoT TaxID=3411797 RepID=UPI003BF4A6C8